MIEVIFEDEQIGGNYYTYYFIGDLAGTRSYSEEDYEEPLTDKEIQAYEPEIEEAIEKYDEGEPNLAKYFDDPDIKIDEVNIGIKYIDGEMHSYTKITTLEPLDTDEKINKVRDWLTGQYSDGWGEGFEQQYVDHYRDQYEVEEEYEDEDGNIEYETNYEYQDVTVHIHFWQPDMEPLRFERG